MLDHSRAILLGSRAADVPPQNLEERLQRSWVHLSADPSTVRGLLTLRVSATTLRRLPIGVSVDPRGLPSGFVGMLGDLGHRLDPSRGIQFRENPSAGAQVLHIGSEAREQAIRAVPDGYGAHIARDPNSEIHVARPAHPLGAIYTAALGVAEVFKDLAGVRAVRRVDQAHLRWCPVSMSHDLTSAPLQEGRLSLQLLLAGCGAVGTAIAMILAELDAEGSIAVVDLQRFGPENVATYSLGDIEDARRRLWKVSLVRRALPNFTVRRLRTDVALLPELVDRGAVPWPSLVLAGLDSVHARHDLQRLWPDRLIDAGTGDTAVGLHDVVGDVGPCLMCFLPAQAGPSVASEIARRFQIPLERLARGDDPLLPEEIAHLPPDLQDILRPHVGKPVCSLANGLGLTGDAAGYQPAVPFIAQQAACLTIGRMIASQLGLAFLPNFLEYDGLVGPNDEAWEQRRALATCYCQQRRELIRQVREQRARSAEGT